MSDDLETFVIEAACKRLLMRYATAVDRKAFDEVLTVFAPDATWQRPGQPLLEGAGQIRGFFEALEAKRRSPEFPDGHRQRHLFTTFDVEVESPDRASSTAYCLVYRDEAPTDAPSPMRDPEVVCQYTDRYVRTAEGWKIAEHAVAHVFRIADYAERLSAAETARIQVA